MSGIEGDARTFQVYTLRDGKITRMDEFNDKASALEAAEATPGDDEHLPLDLPYRLSAYEDDADASPGDGFLGDKMDG